MTISKFWMIWATHVIHCHFNFMPNYRLQIYTDDVTQTNCIPFEHPPAMMEAFVSGINTFSCEQIKRKKGAWTRTSGLGASSSRMASQSLGLRSRNSFQNFKHYTVSTWACLAVDSLELQVMCNKVSGIGNSFEARLHLSLGCFRHGSPRPYTDKARFIFDSFYNSLGSCLVLL